MTEPAPGDASANGCNEKLSFHGFRQIMHIQHFARARDLRCCPRCECNHGKCRSWIDLIRRVASTIDTVKKDP